MRTPIHGFRRRSQSAQSTIAATARRSGESTVSSTNSTSSSRCPARCGASAAGEARRARAAATRTSASPSPLPHSGHRRPNRVPRAARVQRRPVTSRDDQVPRRHPRTPATPRKPRRGRPPRRRAVTLQQWRPAPPTPEPSLRSSRLPIGCSCSRSSSRSRTSTGSASRLPARPTRGRPLLFVKQKKMKIKEDIRFRLSPDDAAHLFMIKSKSVFEFRGRHEVLDATGAVIGLLEKDFRRSLLRSPEGGQAMSPTVRNPCISGLSGVAAVMA